MEQRYDEWHALETKARHWLEQPETIPGYRPPQNGELILHLWHFPAHADHYAWSLYRCAAPQKYLVRALLWPRTQDASRLLDPLEGVKYGFPTEPTLLTREAAIGTPLLETHLSALGNINLPLQFDNPWGIDGETCGFATGSDFNNVRISWYCAGPPQWRELIAWCGQMREMLLGSFD